MARRPSPSATGPDAKPARAKPKAAAPPVTATRVDRLVEVIDHCTAARDAADDIGEKFLSYLLAMAIQESRAAMRRTPVPLPPRD